MKNIRSILKKKILKEFFEDSESTHYDTENNRKVKVFDDTIDFHRNTVKAEITSGKNKGLFTVVNLDNLVELNPNKMVAEYSSNLPMGAEYDSNAPWNEKESAELKKSNNQYEKSNLGECSYWKKSEEGCYSCSAKSKDFIVKQRGELR